MVLILQQLHQLKKKTLYIPKAKIAPSLQFIGNHDTPSKQTVTGVTTTKQDLLAGRYYALDETPAYSPARKYYESDGTEKHATYTPTATDKFYEAAGNNYNRITASITSPDYPAINSGYYSITEGTTTYAGNHVKTAAVKYTQAECNDYNSVYVTGYIASGSTLSTDQAAAVNGALGTEYVAEAVISETDANNYNATLPGARKVTDDKEPAVYGYEDLSSTTDLYTKSGDNYVYAGTAGTGTLWGSDKGEITYYTIASSAIAAASIGYTYPGDVYDVERNYFMVVPTDNVKRLITSLDKDVEKGLRTIRVKIEYYITTEDSKLAGGRVQTKNVIEKDVVFPSLANGKSYMLNLVLGLTSVKMDAEVDEWKVTNVNGYLPQNTDN